MDLGALLNESGIREALREQFPHLDRLESLDSLKDLRLTRIDARGDESFVVLSYEATATEGFYPNVRTRLVAEGIGSKNNVTVTKEGCKGTSEEYERVRISFSDSQTILKVYNPGYSP